jgi:hypothetical protein
MTDAVKSKETGKEERESLFLIGAFLGVFGVAVLIAIAFTETYRGRVANLICGLAFLLIAGVALYKSRVGRTPDA